MSTPSASTLSGRNLLGLQPLQRVIGRCVGALSACTLLLCALAVVADEEAQPSSDRSTEQASLLLQLEMLNRKQAALEAQAAQVQPLQRQLDASQSAAERAEARAEALRIELEKLRQQRQGEAQKHSAQLTAAELRLREHKDRLGNLDAHIQRLEQQLAQREAQIAVLQAAEARRAEAKHQLEQRIHELRARLPAPEGGTVTATEARAQARADAETLERLIREGQGINNPQLWQHISEAENALHRAQYLLARAEGSRTVYRVRPGDSLAQISAMQYGTDQAWERIFEANRHLLDDPERVLPGLTLVIP
ncbi:MAG: LysM peptidoglycan-binding domain-containing protein [Lamprobacter sp.]|uniref:LysM peptidoglycan-binding domain-containing protein n=1 Tax=Lamprobacter sp. TaxID=3100796 RepID=UPI002B25B412|nr:LysM peptidoglycan-binding domain-containing protein [Lamprobacter sp.]MEA3640410.1 LysM peptidoglycan-binding domain-containing protein [Lamprobacter sp.]